MSHLPSRLYRYIAGSPTSPSRNALPVPPYFPALGVVPLCCNKMLAWGSRLTISSDDCRKRLLTLQIELSVELTGSVPPILLFPIPSADSHHVPVAWSYCYDLIMSCLAYGRPCCMLSSPPFCRGDTICGRIMFSVQ